MPRVSSITSPRTRILRNDNGTVTEHTGTSLIISGWVDLTGSGGSQVTSSVTYGITFTQPPIVIAVWGGDNDSSGSYGAGGNIVKGLATCKAEDIGTGDFTIRIRTTDGTAWASTDHVFAQWVAIGEI